MCKSAFLRVCVLLPAVCPLTGAMLAAAQCQPDPSVLRLNDETVLYLPRNAATSRAPDDEAVRGAVTLTASRCIKVWTKKVPGGLLMVQGSQTGCGDFARGLPAYARQCKMANA